MFKSHFGSRKWGDSALQQLNEIKHLYIDFFKNRSKYMTFPLGKPI